MTKKYTISDGKMVLVLEPAENGWLAVTCPFEPGLFTQAKTVQEAFANAYDAKKSLDSARMKLRKELGKPVRAKRSRRCQVAESV